MSKEPDEECLYSGWLMKEGGRIKTWRRRFFVLSPRWLSYYKRSGDTTPLGRIDLESSGHVRGVEYKSLRGAFQIQTLYRTYYLQADTPADRDGWVTALNAALAAHKQTTSLRPPPALTDFTVERVERTIRGGLQLTLAKKDPSGEKFLLLSLPRNLLGPRSAALLRLVQLHHPCIENIIHVFSEPTRLVVATPWIQDRPLLPVVTAFGRPLPPVLAILCSAEILAGLAHLHRAGLACGGFGRDAVRLNNEGYAFLGEVSLGQTCIEESPGAPYAEPGWAPGAGIAGDAWSWGCFVYCLTTGKELDEVNRDVIKNGSIHGNIKDLLVGVLDSDREKREKAFMDASRHKYFGGVDWEALINREIFLRDMWKGIVDEWEVNETDTDTDKTSDAIDDFDGFDASSPSLPQ